MNQIANKIFDNIVSQEINTEEMREHYVYGIEVLFGKIISYGTLLIMAAILDMWLPTIIFMITFYSLRSRTGGHHAKNFLQCYIGTICGYFLLMEFVAPYLIKNDIAFIVIMVVSVPVILLYAPIDHPNLQLSEEEKKACKKSTKMLLLLILICIGVVEILNIGSAISVYIAIGVGMDAGLILIAKLYRRGESYEEKN
ncbi:MAG: accessory gene regulator B family protein [Lachnospiraceae bacterium]|nr:accessory gene regulator B family protein [Lachnospiraceae bacterium]